VDRVLDRLHARLLLLELRARGALVKALPSQVAPRVRAARARLVAPALGALHLCGEEVHTRLEGRDALGLGLRLGGLLRRVGLFRLLLGLRALAPHLGLRIHVRLVRPLLRPLRVALELELALPEVGNRLLVCARCVARMPCSATFWAFSAAAFSAFAEMPRVLSDTAKASTAASFERAVFSVFSLISPSVATYWSKGTVRAAAGGGVSSAARYLQKASLS